MSELTTLFKNTADAIRSKTGDTATMKASQFPAKIRGISMGISQDEADARYLQLSGGTMTGPLNLSGAPTTDNQAATKKYVDDNAGGWKQLTHVSSHSFSSDDTFRVNLSALPVDASNIKLTGVVAGSEYIDLRGADNSYPLSSIGGNFTITMPIAFYVDSGKTQRITGIINNNSFFVGKRTGTGLDTMYLYDSDNSATLSNFKLFYK